VWAVQQQPVAMIPELHIAGHRLTVQADVVRQAAEEHVKHLVACLHQLEFVLVSEDALPAVRPLKSVAHGPVVATGFRSARTRLVQPARLRHANRADAASSCQHVQQRNLHGEGELVRQPPIGRRAPEQQAPRKRQQVQRASQIGEADGRRKSAEWPEGEEIPHTVQPLCRLPQVRARPGREVFLPESELWIAVGWQDAETGMAQVRFPFAIGSRQQAADKIERLRLGQLATRSREEAAPERPSRPLLAGTKHGPGRTAFVILAARQRQRKQRDIALVIELAGALG